MRILVTHRRHRSGSIESTVVILVAALFVVGCIAHFIVGGISSTVQGFFDDQPKIDFLTTRAFEAPFFHVVLERGEVESSSNVEVRCQVRGRSSTGINILEIVPEGTWVEEGRLFGAAG